MQLCFFNLLPKIKSGYAHTILRILPSNLITILFKHLLTPVSPGTFLMHGRLFLSAFLGFFMAASVFVAVM